MPNMKSADHQIMAFFQLRSYAAYTNMDLYKHRCDHTNQVKPTLNLIPTTSLDIQIAVEKAWQLPKTCHKRKNLLIQSMAEMSPFLSEIFFYQHEVLVRFSSLKDIWYFGIW